MISQIKKILAMFLIGSIVTTVLVTVSIIVFGQVDRLELKIIMSLLTLTGLFALALACAPRKKQNQWLTSTSLSVVGITLILTLSEIWSGVWTLAFWRCIAVAWLVSMACAYVCSLSFRQVSGWVKLVRICAFFSVVLLIGILILCLFDFSYLRTIEISLFKTIGGLAIMSTGGALIVLVASWLKL